MWIERLEVAGFGRLEDDFEFSPGLTVVTGPNEAGKSTLHRAVVTSLFGFSRPERRRHADGPSRLAQCAPWSGSQFRLRAIVNSDAGRFRASWTFSADDSSQALVLTNESTADELTASVAQKHGSYELGRHLMGLDYEEFCQVSMLSQAAIDGVQRSDSLVDALRQAVEMGASEHGVDEASAILEKALRSERIGVRVDNLAPLQNRQLQTSMGRLEQVSVAIEVAEQQQAELRRLADELESERASESETLSRRNEVQQSLFQSRVHDLAGRIESAEESLAHSQETVVTAPHLDLDVATKTAALFEQRQRLQTQLLEGEAEAGASRELVKRIEGEAAEVRDQLLGVDAFRTVDSSQQIVVRDSLSRIEEIDAEPEEQAPELSGGLNGLAIAAIVVALVSVLLAALASPVALTGLLAAAGLAWYGRRENTARPAGLQVQPGRRSGLQAKLVSALDSAGAPPAGDALIRARSYLDSCESRTHHDELSARIAALKQRSTEAGAADIEARRRTLELDDLDGELREQVESLGIDATDLRSAGRELSARIDAAQQAKQASARAEGNVEGLEAALGGRTLEELKQDRDSAKKGLRDHRETHGDLPSVEKGEDALQRVLAELGGKVEGHSAEVGRLNGLISAAEQELGSVPALREERVELSSRIERIELAVKAIDIARDVLGEAAADAHQRFAPLLNDAIAADLPTITSGRYTQARINETLEMRLIAPETGEAVDVDVLSRGTQDQIFLIERLAILRMLVAEKVTPPLLLDDVLVHFDEARTRSALEILAREAEERQVILFAGDANVVEAVNELDIEHQLITLQGPG